MPHDDCRDWFFFAEQRLDVDRRTNWIRKFVHFYYNFKAVQRLVRLQQSEDVRFGHDRNGQTGAGWTRKRAESLRWKRLSLFYKVDSHVQLFVDALDRWPATVHHGGNSLEAAVWRRQVAWRRWNAPFHRPTSICLKEKG
ncbi:hypothetical protein T09_9961 [Trichinella sp. T9]|nr:hypothetical protein T09_9961 [Trichinella sp. T9]KRZ83271.1 hypothetical protein T08_12634 [Trichinella sp. T8]